MKLRKGMRSPDVVAKKKREAATLQSGARDHMAGIAAYHRHLDACYRCRNNPFDLCPKGAELLWKAAQ